MLTLLAILGAVLVRTGVGSWIGIRVLPRRRRGAAAVPVDTALTVGRFIETDCRACGQRNRVPGSRLRDRPRCGKCQRRLMPGRRLTICRARPMTDALDAELDTVWDEPDRLWGCLADHVAEAEVLDGERELIEYHLTGQGRMAKRAESEGDESEGDR